MKSFEYAYSEKLYSNTPSLQTTHLHLTLRTSGCAERLAGSSKHCLKIFSMTRPGIKPVSRLLSGRSYQYTKRQQFDEWIWSGRPGVRFRLESEVFAISHIKANWSRSKTQKIYYSQSQFSCFIFSNETQFGFAGF